MNNSKQGEDNISFLAKQIIKLQGEYRRNESLPEISEIDLFKDFSGRLYWEISGFNKRFLRLKLSRTLTSKRLIDIAQKQYEPFGKIFPKILEYGNLGLSAHFYDEVPFNYLFLFQKDDIVQFGRASVEFNKGSDPLILTGIGLEQALDNNPVD
jgi:hypothetical protein